MEVIRKFVLPAIFYIALSYFTFLMFLITIQYIPIDYNTAFLNLKEEAIAYTHYKIAFFSHVYTSIFVLILGLPQFSSWLRVKHTNVHRLLGKLYIALILFIASPSGFIMALYANGGLGSQVSFGIQALLWFYFTLAAMHFAQAKDFTLHENFMLRSYALTLSAISLRLFKLGIVTFLEWPPMDTYRWVSWLGWLFNIAVVEMYILSKS